MERRLRRTRTYIGALLMGVLIIAVCSLFDVGVAIQTRLLIFKIELLVAFILFSSNITISTVISIIRKTNKQATNRVVRRRVA